MTARGMPFTTVTLPLMYRPPAAGEALLGNAVQGPAADGAVRWAQSQHLNRWKVPLSSKGPLTSPASFALNGCRTCASLDGGRGGVTLVMLQVRGQLLHFHAEAPCPHSMSEQGTAGPERLPLPRHTEQAGGQPGQCQALPHGSAAQQGGGSSARAVAATQLLQMHRSSDHTSLFANATLRHRRRCCIWCICGAPAPTVRCCRAWCVAEHCAGVPNQSRTGRRARLTVVSPRSGRPRAADENAGVHLRNTGAHVRGTTIYARAPRARAARG
eukprot:SAG31_NODE_8219_length_1494_cov_1.469534_1_plen_271_part_00